MSYAVPFALVCAVAALVYGGASISWILAKPTGNDRMREIAAAIQQGFARAFGTIIDTHMTTIISALFLFQFGTGPIKGFAVTLLIGLFASVFTAFFVSRVIFDIVYKPSDRPTEISI